MAKYVLDKMSKVKNKLVIDSPYFIVDKPHKKILKRLLEEKKHVEVFTNGLYSTDAIYVNAVFNSSIGRWLKRGIRPFVFRGISIDNYPTLNEEIKSSRWGTHTKSFVFDDNEVLIGTYNFDPRSNRYNNEMAVGCIGSDEMVAQMDQELSTKKLASYSIKTKKDLRKVKFENITFGKGLLYYIVKPFALLFKFLL